MRKNILLILFIITVILCGCDKQNDTQILSSAIISNTTSSATSSKIISNTKKNSIQNQTTSKTNNEIVINSTSESKVIVESTPTNQKEEIKVLPTEQNFSQISSNKANPILRLYLLYCVQLYEDKLDDAQKDLTYAENNKCELIWESGKWRQVANVNAVNSAQNDVNRYQGQLDIFTQTSKDYNIVNNTEWVLEKNILAIEPLLKNQIISYISKYKNELNKSEIYLKTVQDNKNVLKYENGQTIKVADERLVNPALIVVRDNKRELKYWTSFADICGISY